LATKNIKAGFSLIDSEARHRAHPERWDYPRALIALGIIRRGWLLKIGIENRADPITDPEHPPLSGERFWCRVQEVTQSGFVVKVEQSDMLCSEWHGIEDGDILTVERRHILDVEPPAPVTVATPTGFPPGEISSTRARRTRSRSSRWFTWA
jgi:hypothetical protein